jgi:hypothetical protein
VGAILLQEGLGNNINFPKTKTMQHQHFYHRPSSSFDESSIDEPHVATIRFAHARGDRSFSSDDEVDYEDEEKHDNLRPLLVSTYSGKHQDHHVDSFRSASGPIQGGKRKEVDEVDSSESNVLCASKKSNIGGSHVMKCGQKLIGELFDPKNEDAMNSILR